MTNKTASRRREQTKRKNGKTRKNGSHTNGSSSITPTNLSPIKEESSTTSSSTHHSSKSNILPPHQQGWKTFLPFLLMTQLVGVIAALLYIRIGVVLICPRDDITGAFHSVETVETCHDVPISTPVHKQVLFWKKMVHQVSYESIPSHQGYPPLQVVCRGSLQLLERVNEWLPGRIRESGWIHPKSIVVNPCEDLERIARHEEGLMVVVEGHGIGNDSPLSLIDGSETKAMVLVRTQEGKRVQLPSLDGDVLLDLPMIGESRDMKESRELRKKKKKKTKAKKSTKQLELAPPSAQGKEGGLIEEVVLKNPVIKFVHKILRGVKHLIRIVLPPKQTKAGEEEDVSDTVIVEEAAKESPDWSVDVSSPLYLSLTPAQKSLVSTLKHRFKTLVSQNGSIHDFDKRMEGVRWGGPEKSSKSASFPWYFPLESSPPWGRDKEESGTRLLTAILKIVKWPNNLMSNFPFKMCGSEQCPVEVALSHTLEFREKYQPWKMTDAAYRENKSGWMYVRGYSPTRHHDDASKGGYALVWYRPGKKKIEDYEPYIRVVINSLDRCVADSLSRSGGHVGKCNVVLDCSGFGMMMIPPMKFVKKILPMMQDHFPDRMGVLVLVNLAGAAQVFMGIVTPFLPDAVKKKIHILPNEGQARDEMLQELIDEQFVPTWLGGEDDYSFNAAEYYKRGNFETEFFTDEEGTEYVKSMPYHS